MPPFASQLWAAQAKLFHEHIAGTPRLVPAQGGDPITFKLNSRGQEPHTTESGVLIFDTLRGAAIERLSVNDRFLWEGQSWRVSEAVYSMTGDDDFPHSYTLLGRVRAAKDPDAT